MIRASAQNSIAEYYWYHLVLHESILAETFTVVPNSMFKVITDENTMFQLTVNP